MDQQSKPLTDEAKKIVFNQLADIALDSLEKGIIPFEEKGKLADLVLSKMNAVTNYAELTSFLNELSQLYPVFRDFLAQIKNEEAKVEDATQINKIKNEIDQMEP